MYIYMYIKSYIEIFRYLDIDIYRVAPDDVLYVCIEVHASCMYAWRRALHSSLALALRHRVNPYPAGRGGGSRRGHPTGCGRWYAPSPRHLR